MGVVERRGNLADDARDKLRCQGPALTEHRAQVGLDEQHRDVEDTAILARGVDGHDVRMPLEHGQGTGLGDEAPPVAFVSGKLAREHLDRDAAPEPCCSSASNTDPNAPRPISLTRRKPPIASPGPGAAPISPALPLLRRF